MTIDIDLSGLSVTTEYEERVESRTCGKWYYKWNPVTKMMQRGQRFCNKCDSCKQYNATYWSQQAEQHLRSKHKIRILENATSKDVQAITTRMGKKNYTRFPHDGSITLLYKEEYITTREGQLLNENSRALTWKDLGSDMWMQFNNRNEDTRATGKLIQIAPKPPTNTNGDSFETVSWSDVGMSALESAYLEAEKILGEADKTDYDSYQEWLRLLNEQVEDILIDRNINAIRHFDHIRLQIDYLQDNTYELVNSAYSAVDFSDVSEFLPPGADLIGLAP